MSVSVADNFYVGKIKGTEVDAGMWYGVAFSALSGATKAMEAISCWEFCFCLVSVKRGY